MTDIAELIVATARSWIGTPYGHQGRTKGIIADCAGVPVGVAMELGLAVSDITDYSREPNPARMKQYLETNLERVSKSDMRAGDIAWIRFAKHPQHLAIIGDYSEGQLSLIHANNLVAAGIVTEHRLDDQWMARIVSVWRYRDSIGTQ